jgi:hypothetical protein
MPGIAIPGIFCATADTQRNGKCSTVFGCMSPFMPDAVKWAPLIFSQEGHDLKLRDAGAVHLAQSWSDVERFALRFFNG